MQAKKGRIFMGFYKKQYKTNNNKSYEHSLLFFLADIDVYPYDLP